jgi:HlyD family secretion protein
MKFQGSKLFKDGVRWLVGAGVIAVLGTGIILTYILWINRSNPPVPVRVVTVARQTVENIINESGVVELGGQQTLKSPTEGAVDQVLVKPGDRVQAGQTLIVLRNPERQTAPLEQQIKIDQQQATLERSRQEIIEAQEQLAAYRKDLEPLKVLQQEGAIARTEVRDREDQIRRTEATLREAQAEASKARLELERLKVENRRIQQQLQETAITASTSGIILQINVNNGDGVEFRTDLLTLGNPTQELVKLELSTLNAARVKAGQLTRVSVIGPDPEIFTGRVVSISPMAIVPEKGDNTSKSSGQSSQVVVPTVVRLDRATRTLLPGSQVNVEIVLESQKNVIALGSEAIQRTEAKPFVWVLDKQGRAQRRPVKLGLEGLVTVEVVDGLRPEERVILPPDQPLNPGMPVVPKDN